MCIQYVIGLFKKKIVILFWSNVLIAFSRAVTGGLGNWRGFSRGRLRAACESMSEIIIPFPNAPPPPPVHVVGP